MIDPDDLRDHLTPAPGMVPLFELDPPAICPARCATARNGFVPRCIRRAGHIGAHTGEDGEPF